MNLRIQLLWNSIIFQSISDRCSSIIFNQTIIFPVDSCPIHFLHQCSLIFVKLPLSTPENCRGCAEVYNNSTHFSHRFLMEVSGQHHASSALTPRKNPATHATGGWVGPRASLGVAQKRKISLLCDKREHMFIYQTGNAWIQYRVLVLCNIEY
jgi:hypothetical protein